MSEYYPYEAYEEEFAPAIEDESSRLRRYNRRYTLGKLRRFVEKSGHEGGKLLDLGCGTGNFLAHMRDRGAWDVYGLDVNRRAVSYARDRLDIEVRGGTLKEARYPADFFDVVSMWNVLEHLHDPVATLREVKRILQPEGALFLSVPNSGSVDARLFGPCWVGLDPPRHLYTFDRTTLELLLARSGFRMAESAHVTGSYHSLVTSAGLALKRRQGLPRPLRRIFNRAVSSWPVHVVIFPWLKIVEAIGRGAILTVRAEPQRSPRSRTAVAISEEADPLSNPQ